MGRIRRASQKEYVFLWRLCRKLSSSGLQGWFGARDARARGGQGATGVIWHSDAQYSHPHCDFCCDCSRLQPCVLEACPESVSHRSFLARRRGDRANGRGPALDRLFTNSAMLPCPGLAIGPGSRDGGRLRTQKKEVRSALCSIASASKFHANRWHRPLSC